MIKAKSTDFVGILSEDKPPMVLFRYSDEEPVFAKLLKDVLKDYPLMNTYEYIIDESYDNQVLAEHLGIESTPVLMIYKNGSFSRYKDKNFTKKQLTMFLGSKVHFSAPKPKEAKTETI